MTAFVRGMYGLGDNIYQRPFVRALASRGECQLATSWPQLYSDIPGVTFSFPSTTLRTQVKNIQSVPRTTWSSLPMNNDKSVVNIKLQYKPSDLENATLISGLERCIPLSGYPFKFDLPRFESTIKFASVYAVVRPVTRRSEWESDSRNPDPAYIQEAINVLASLGIAVVTIADVDEKNEWFVGDPPTGQAIEYHHGELSVTDMVEVIRGAALCVGGIGWILPMCLATGTPAFIVQGGRGAHNAIQKLTDPRIDTSKIGAAVPDRFCMCNVPVHGCDKRISDFGDKLKAWIGRVA